jgi:hypothetical protein
LNDSARALGFGFVIIFQCVRGFWFGANISTPPAMIKTPFANAIDKITFISSSELSE